MLSDESVRDRADDRACDDNGDTWSLYCALSQATYEVIGSSHHYQPAMDLVRDVIRESYVDRVDGHHLMDFNNHTATTLSDVDAVIDRADVRLRERLRL